MDTQSVETGLLRGPRYANLPLTHSGIDTYRNFLAQPERPCQNSNRALRTRRIIGIVTNLVVVFTLLLFKACIVPARYANLPLTHSGIYTYRNFWPNQSARVRIAPAHSEPDALLRY